MIPCSRAILAQSFFCWWETVSNLSRREGMPSEPQIGGFFVYYAREKERNKAERPAGFSCRFSFFVAAQT